MSDHPTEYALCVELHGSCKCEFRSEFPCSGIVEMIENGTTAASERHRIEEARTRVDWDGD